jgi:predicted nucleotidyltransferase
MSAPTDRWPALRQLVEVAEEAGAIEVWLFGSALRSSSPRDLDVLVVYLDERVPPALRSSAYLELLSPPIDLIAMTPDEVDELNFLVTVPAVRLYPEPEAELSSKAP